MAELHEFEDAFYETESSSGSLIRLSHLNNKSSVLCPEKQDITSQYLVLQQLDAHQRMISRAKSIVDTSAPKSLQSYISVADRQRKKCWQKLENDSNEPEMDNLNGTYKQQITSRLQTPFSEEGDNVSLNASSVNKGVQTGIPFETVSSKTADKISWYLEALNHGELYSQPFIYADNSRNVSRESNVTLSTSKFQKKVVKGDIMDFHEKSFVKPQKPFSPRILANSSAKAKLKDMRCYNPPFRKKKSNSSHSSDTFESYDNDEESEEDVQKSSATSSVEEEAQADAPQSRDIYSNFKHSFWRSSLHQNSDYFETSYNSDSLTRTEEDKYLSFLSKVTEDILRSGVYSDKAIQQAFEFHMQFYKEESNKEKLQSLLNQVLDGLKISSEDAEVTGSYRNPLPFHFSRPNTPPERESFEILPTNNPLGVEAELNSTVQGQTLNPHSTNAVLHIDQSTLQENTHTLEEES